MLVDARDLSDMVKGRQQYWLKVEGSADALRDAGLSWRTVCQCNATIIPHLHGGKNKITFLSSGRALVSAGPHKDQAEAHIVEGKIGSSSVTLELAAPRNA